MERPVTIVSCFYPIKKSKHGIGEYYKWIFHFLTCVNTPIVMFGEKETIEIMREMRRLVGLLDTITFIEKPFDQLKFSTPEWIQRWTEQVPMSHFKDLHCQELYRVWANKTFFVQEVIEKNPYGSSTFMWCDSGCWRDYAAAQLCGSEWPLLDKMVPGRMHFLTVNTVRPMLAYLEERSEWTHEDIVKQIETSNKQLLSGSMFCGDKEAWEQWIPAYEATLDLFFKNGLFAGDDQHVMLSAAFWLRATLPENKKPVFFQAPPTTPFLQVNGKIIGNVWFAFHEHFSKIPFRLEMY